MLPDDVRHDGHQARSDVLDVHRLVEHDVEGEDLEEDIGPDEEVVRVGRVDLVRPVHERAVVELEQHDDVDRVDALVLRHDLDLDVRVVVVLRGTNNGSRVSDKNSIKQTNTSRVSDKQYQAQANEHVTSERQEQYHANEYVTRGRQEQYQANEHVMSERQLQYQANEHVTREQQEQYQANEHATTERQEYYRANEYVTRDRQELYQANEHVTRERQ